MTYIIVTKTGPTLVISKAGRYGYCTSNQLCDAYHFNTREEAEECLRYNNFRGEGFEIFGVGSELIGT